MRGGKNAFLLQLSNSDYIFKYVIKNDTNKLEVNMIHIPPVADIYNTQAKENYRISHKCEGIL
jgi:hypothetical protein